MDAALSLFHGTFILRFEKAQLAYHHTLLEKKFFKRLRQTGAPSTSVFTYTDWLNRVLLSPLKAEELETLAMKRRPNPR